MPINVYAILGPFVIALVLIEFVYCLYKKNGYYTLQDSISSLGTMILTQCTNLFVAWLIWRFFTYLAAHVAITALPDTSWNYLFCFFAIDFLFYWFHRYGHEINFLWAAHMPHHSTEELNYAVGLRASLTQRLASFLFYWPLVIIGFSPAMIIEVVAFHLLLQFVPHTRVVPKLHPFIEYIFNTPSHHRVHHGLNAQYIDKNYGGFLIIWDRIFGTYEEEVEEVFYGVTVQPKTWEPTFINFQVWVSLFRDCLATPFWWDKIRLWFMPTGWRPRGVAPHPTHPVWTKDTFVKFQSTPIPHSTGYLIFQVILTYIVIFYIIADSSPLNALEKNLFGSLLWLTTMNWAFFLESKAYAIPLELLRIIAMSGLLLYSLQKYHLNQSIVYFSIAMICASIVWFIHLVWKQKPGSEQSVMAN